MKYHTSTYSVACTLLFIGTFSALSLYATAGAGSRESSERPAVNYYGTLEDASGQRSSIEYLAIGSRTITSRIPVYGLGRGSTANPRTKTTYLDLNDIRELTIAPNANPPLCYEGTAYTEVVIMLKNPDGEQPVSKNFLIESTRKLWCDELVAGTRRIPQELQLPAIKKIMITGARSADLEYRDIGEPHLSASEREQRKNHSCSQAAKTLNALEAAANNLPEPHKGSVKSLIESIQNWVGGLCSG
jgi:hypothetical protein